MRSLLVGGLLTIIGLSLTGRAIRGQDVATAQAATPKVKQGASVTMAVRADKAPNVAVLVNITVLPEGEKGHGMVLVGQLSALDTECTVSRQLAGDAKIGKWKVTKIAVRPVVGGPEKELPNYGDISFEVIPSNFILPDSVTILRIN